MPTPIAERRWRRALGWLGVDQAVTYAVLTRIWQLLAGPVTSLLIVFCFSKVVQGYYFTIWSLIQLQTFVELGTQWAILYVASHEWAKLRLEEHGGIAGDKSALSRLSEMIRMARNWFAVAAVIFVVAAGSAGVVLFSRKHGELDWFAPWASVVVVAGIGLVLSPYISMLEGCDQMAAVNRNRLFQAVSGSLVVWIAILAGANLWVALVAVTAQLFWEALLLARFRNFWRSLSVESRAQLSWQREVWPLQWRLALQSIFRFFAFGLFVPVMFACHSAELAGRMGLTWMVLSAFQQAAFSWVRTKAPKFGALITGKQYQQLDEIFGRVTSVSVGVLLLALAGFCAAVAFLNWYPHAWCVLLSERLLDPLPTLAFSLSTLLLHLAACLGVYLRAHKRDPILALTVAANTLIGILVLVVGGRFGVLPAACCLLAVQGLVTVPGTVWIWSRCRAAWHAA